MKDFKKLMLFGVAFLSMAVVGCNGNGQNSNSNNGNSSSGEPEKEAINPIVFVLTGQSNMEGQSYWKETRGGTTYHLKNAMESLSQKDEYSYIDVADYDNLAPADDESLDDVTGIENVRTSFYGCGYGEIYTESNVHASNNETGHKIDGKFINTRVGMGYQDTAIGPELGAAYRLSPLLEEGQMVYFIKCGVSGSGFAQDGSRYGGDRINWDVTKDESLYSNILKPYTENCLDLIEEEAGAKPIIRGFLWMQGESDSDENKIPVYAERMNNLLNKFKEDFEEYAPNEEKEEIAFIDACIYDKIGGQWGDANSLALNQVKMQNAADHDNYYCINTSWRIEGGMELTTGSPGGNGGAHYSTESMLKLGIAFADVMIENNLLYY